jgi:hypothetical protein
MHKGRLTREIQNPDQTASGYARISIEENGIHVY